MYFASFIIFFCLNSEPEYIYLLGGVNTFRTSITLKQVKLQTKI